MQVLMDGLLSSWTQGGIDYYNTFIVDFANLIFLVITGLTEDPSL